MDQQTTHTLKEKLAAIERKQDEEWENTMIEASDAVDGEAAEKLEQTLQEDSRMRSQQTFNSDEEWYEAMVEQQFAESVPYGTTIGAGATQEDMGMAW